MPVFNLSEFEQENKNTKIKVFIKFLYEKFKVTPNSKEFDNIYFSLFNEDDLIESLEYYIKKNRVTAKVTAANYITYITEFFGMLSEQYNIKNDIFINIEENKKFSTKSKEIISRLRKTVSKDYASDEQYQDLINGIDDFLSRITEDDIYDEINKYFHKNIKYTKLYHRFISVIAIKLVIKFALCNLSVISLGIDNLNMETNTLSINGFRLPLDEDLIHLFKSYLMMREYILNIHERHENLLFIKPDGTPYIKSSSHRDNVQNYASFFKIMKDIIGTQSAELFAKRRILEMFDSGLNISTVAQLSEMSIEKCIELQNSNNKETDINSKLKLLFDNDSQIDINVPVKKKGYFICPFCGAEAEAISDEWILVQFQDSTKKYLACKLCRGEYEKRYIQNI